MRNFGEGWMSKNASDLCKILFVFGNLNPKDLLRVLRPSKRMVNCASIEKAVAILQKEAQVA